MLREDAIAGAGNTYDFGARLLSSLYGSWFSIDPLAGKYPSFSPYVAVGGNPISFIDYDGRDFGIKYEDNKIIIIANIYVLDEENEKYATRGASVWNNTKYTINGKEIVFDIAVKKIDWNPIKKEYNIENLLDVPLEFLATESENVMKRDPIGNIFFGFAKFHKSQSKEVGGEQVVAGVADHKKRVFMNSHNILGNFSSNKLLVGHEFGHLFGLDDDKPGKEYFPGIGIMKYGSINDVRKPSINDVETILRYAEDFLSGKPIQEGHVTKVNNLQDYRPVNGEE